MDTAMGYDKADPNKTHHPLVAGRISLTMAHNVIHWGLCGLSVAAILISLNFSPDPLLSMVAVLLWVVFGFAYNNGLSKESVLGFLPITMDFTAMGAWGWSLSHGSFDTVGYLLLSFIFFTLLFQVSWSGHIKELGQKEKSNILLKMGLHFEGKKVVVPSYAKVYGIFVKSFNLFLGYLIIWELFSPVKLVYMGILTVLVIFFLHQLTKTRIYQREKELRNMSMMEVLTIYAVPPLVLSPIPAATLMAIGVVYFFGMNKILWGTSSFPRV